MSTLLSANSTIRGSTLRFQLQPLSVAGPKLLYYAVAVTVTGPHLYGHFRHIIVTVTETGLSEGRHQHDKIV